MTTTTENGPTHADLAGLNPEDYRDTCDHCIAVETAHHRYTTLPHKVRPTRTGLVARYRHHCGHTWVCGWGLPHRR
ncbi:hypothetical protein CDO52_12825 [Nocardiopsis gilva YIM 90087]|uniref:Uncharacterized protein n=1 Tax=Nocardiopsis gilva YIM 90087 TaxID=1235441 RepID=A0A223S5X8_9ACTN|nr:hypothetical protein [Nocardiopsis gilva]ASU83553.1 hypothetical protein CDO52_12825 [Nocardiopsis gilva YIM 90087]